jgi:hypothetical protein
MNKKEVIRKVTNSLSGAIALGLGVAATSSTALAVELDNNNRLGDAGIFQYYTATGDWQTFMRIVNTSDEAVAVKVRFREAANSREVLDYIIFLSPRDMWTGWTDANAGGEGVPGVKTNDTSCLYPAPNNNTQKIGWVSVPNSNAKWAAFQDRAFTNGDLAEYDDGGNDNHTPLERMSEGHIEVIGIAQFSGVSDFGRAVSHGDDGKPDSCTAAITIYESAKDDIFDLIAEGPESEESLVQDIANGVYSALAGSIGLPLQNVLAMNAYLINVPQGMGAGYNPDILKDFWSCPLEAFFYCYFEGGDNGRFWEMQIGSLETATNPDMDSAFNPALDYNGLNEEREKQKGYKMIEGGPEYVSGGVDSVSYEFMRSAVINEWAASKSNDPTATIKDYYTQWVLTFPTKHYYVDLQDDDYIFDDVSPTLVDPDESSNEAYRPFLNEFDWNGETFGTGDSCEPFVAHIWNREERYSDFASPSPEFPTALCNETNVVVFNEEYQTKGLGSNFAITIPTGLLPTDANGETSERGWAEFDLTGELYGLDEIRYLNQYEWHFGPIFYKDRAGLPVTGFMLSIYNTDNTGKNHAAANAHAYRVDEFVEVCEECQEPD